MRAVSGLLVSTSIAGLMAAALLIALTSSSRGQDPQPAQPAKPAPVLSCTISAEATIELGAAPSVKVELKNLTDGEIVLVGSLDGSCQSRRYPYCQFTITGPDGNDPVKPAMGCGFMNPLRDKDFVAVAAHGTFDPYMHIDDYGFFPAWQINASTFDKVGEYRLRFTYSTDETDLAKWGGTGSISDEVKAQLARVPRTAVVSNELVIKVVEPKKGD
ncbi:MAG: hypothetical protein AB7K09_08170 [Planctomycetota bacterium]